MAVSNDLCGRICTGAAPNCGGDVISVMSRTYKSCCVGQVHGCRLSCSTYWTGRQENLTGTREVDPSSVLTSRFLRRDGSCTVMKHLAWFLSQATNKGNKTTQRRQATLPRSARPCALLVEVCRDRGVSGVETCEPSLMLMMAKRSVCWHQKMVSLHLKPCCGYCQSKKSGLY